jgi:hypothetical protein
MSDHEEKQQNDPDAGQSTPVMGTRSEEKRAYRYRHAGIEEHEGRIPLWLTLVVVGLLIWSVYYTIQFWSPG